MWIVDGGSVNALRGIAGDRLAGAAQLESRVRRLGFAGWSSTKEKKMLRKGMLFLLLTASALGLVGTKPALAQAVKKECCS
jgi:hypothetical protein